MCIVSLQNATLVWKSPICEGWDEAWELIASHWLQSVIGLRIDYVQDKDYHDIHMFLSYKCNIFEGIQNDRMFYWQLISSSFSVILEKFVIMAPPFPCPYLTGGRVIWLPNYSYSQGAILMPKERALNWYIFPRDFILRYFWDLGCIGIWK